MKTKIILIALAVLVTTACGNKKNQQQNDSSKNMKETIVEITFSEIGGENGFNKYLAITKDSIRYNCSIATPQSQVKYAKATTSKLWDELQNTCDLETFAKIKNGQSVQPVDGTDETFSLTTNQRKLSFTNGSGMEYEKLESFFQLIKQQIIDFQEEKSPIAKEAFSIPEGNYHSDNDKCKISIVIKENDSYSIYMDGKNTRNGVYKISSVDANVLYVNFGAIPAMFDDKVISIQNYGNAMNEYTYFESCDEKYITLIRKK